MSAGSVEAVFLDLDGTICEYREPTSDLLARSFAELGLDPVFTAEEYREELFSQIVTDETMAERREAAFRNLVASAGEDPVVGRRLAAVYAGMRDHRDVRPLPGAIEAVEALADRYRLALVTNGGPETQDGKLDALGIADAFETVVYAGYETAPKPEPNPFLKALTDLDVAPRRTVHVGNSIRADVWGADAAGLRVALLDGDDDPVTAPDYRLDSMHDLTDPPWVSSGR
jgi:putative hydrolase of the HAD superfamily